MRITTARRNGRTRTQKCVQFPLIIDALSRLHARSCIVDGEAVVCGDDGIASFERIRYGQHNASAFLYAFDLIELNGDDLRRECASHAHEPARTRGSGPALQRASR